MPTSKAWGVKAREDFRNDFRSFFPFYSQGSRPREESDLSETTGLLVPNQGLGSALRACPRCLGLVHGITPYGSPVGLLPECFLGPVPRILECWLCHSRDWLCEGGLWEAAALEGPPFE